MLLLVKRILTIRVRKLSARDWSSGLSLAGLLWSGDGEVEGRSSARYADASGRLVAPLVGWLFVHDVVQDNAPVLCSSSKFSLRAYPP